MLLLFNDVLAKGHRVDWASLGYGYTTRSVYVIDLNYFILKGSFLAAVAINTRFAPILC